MPSDQKQTSWLRVSTEITIFYLILITVNYLAVDFWGSEIRSAASYFFGDNPQTTLSILLFIEGGIFLALGSLWALASSENISYGIYRKNYGSFSKQDWESRVNRTTKSGDKILLVVGAFTLVAAFVLVLI